MKKRNDERGEIAIIGMFFVAFGLAIFSYAVGKDDAYREPHRVEKVCVQTAPNKPFVCRYEVIKR